MNLKHEIEKITDGYGCDVYFEVTGNPISVQQGLNILTRQGRFICMSIFKKDVPADWSLIGTYYSIVKNSSADLGVNSNIVQIRPTIKDVSTKISKKKLLHLCQYFDISERK